MPTVAHGLDVMEWNVVTGCAEKAGDVLILVDADVVVQRRTLARIAEDFEQ